VLSIALHLAHGDDTRIVADQYPDFHLGAATTLDNICELASKMFGISGAITLKYEDGEDKITLVHSI
jgi:hypothetical protein